MKLFRLVRFADFLGYNFSIRIKGESGYKSIFGGCLSVLIIILSSIMTFYLGFEIFQKTEPMVINSKIINQDFGPYNVTLKSHIQFFIGLEYANFTYYYDESIYTVTAEESTVEYLESNGTTSQLLTTRKINLRKCSDFYSNGDLDEANLNIPFDLFLCVDPKENAQIQGFWGSRISKSVKVKLQKCVNSTKSQTICKSREKINNYIQNGVLSVYSTDYLVNQKNLTSPTKKYFKNIYNYLSANHGLIYVIAYSDFLFKSDTGFLFPVYSEWSIPMISDIKNSYSFREEEMFAFINFQGFKLADSYQRSYAKIQDILTKVGGLVKALTLIGLGINYVFSRPLFLIDNLMENHNFLKISYCRSINRDYRRIVKISSNENYQPNKNRKDQNDTSKNIILNSNPGQKINPKVIETEGGTILKKIGLFNQPRNDNFSFNDISKNNFQNLLQEKSTHNNQNAIINNKNNEVKIIRKSENRRNSMNCNNNTTKYAFLFLNHNNLNIKNDIINLNDEKIKDIERINNRKHFEITKRKVSCSSEFKPNYLGFKNLYSPENSRIFGSKLSLFKHYWCPRLNVKISKIFDFKERLIGKILSLETLNKIYFDLELIKMLNYNLEEINKIQSVYLNLFQDFEIYEKLRNYLYCDNKEKSNNDFSIFSVFSEDDKTLEKRLEYFKV